MFFAVHNNVNFVSEIQISSLNIFIGAFDQKLKTCYIILNHYNNSINAYFW